MSSNTNLYSRLTLPSKTSIRLIRKEKQEDALVRIHLSVHDIKEPPAYTALSYTWGNPTLNVTEPLAALVVILCNDIPIRIGKSLYDALCILETGPDGYLWIDAISIHQDDVLERNKQVAMMGSIYAQAQGTFIWLGMEDEPTRVAFKAMTRFFKAISKLWTEQGKATYDYGFRDNLFWKLLGITSWTDEEVNCIVHFFNRTWFGRAWIVQEVALAKEILVVCGGSTLWWIILHAVSQFLYMSGWCYEFNELKTKLLGVHRTIPPGVIPMILEKLRQTSANGVLCEGDHRKVISFADVEAREDKLRLFYRALEIAISIFRPFKASVAQDKVYAPLALIVHLFSSTSSFAQTTLLPEVSYEATKEETFICFATAILKHSERTSFLSLREMRIDGHDRRQQHRRLPSWVPDLTIFDFSPLTYLKNPSFHATRHWACLPLCTAPRDPLLNRTLRVNGLLFDYVTRLGPCHGDIALIEIPTPWLEFCYEDMPTTTYIDGKTHRTEAFARTIICDQLRSRPAAEFAATFKSFLTYMCACSNNMAAIRQEMSIEEKNEQDVTLEATLPISWPVLEAFEDTDPNPYVPTLAEIDEYIAMVMNEQAEPDDDLQFHRSAYQLVKRLHYDVSSGRRLIITCKGYIGMAPENVQAGDLIVFLPTSQVPFVIRGVDGQRRFVGNGSKNGDAYEIQMVRSAEYELQGDAYLHGLMDGELFVANSNLACEEIVLV